ncbi:MAG: 2-dehydro-3-deoxy-D-gluconate 5-dehydrogenase KduD [Treponema sp.]|jgi:2-deoxy-D-gluconate 3-dehydrogenase|nr:2-dehydro-3-deoxy-D-gluconate 5-dehydrogenase KduD [Treponema sp.]
MGILDLFKLDGKVAIVTGCGRGLGLGIAQGLAEAGAGIMGVGFAPDAPACRNAVEACGRKFHYLPADLKSQERIPEILEETLKVFGRADILVNNAGIIKRADSTDFTGEDWDEVMNVNLKSLFFLSQAAAKQFIKQGSGGKIIHIASLLSFQGGIRIPSYTAAKSGVRGLTMLMANEWAKHNININAIAPGYFETDNTSALRADRRRYEEITSRIPAGRWGIPQDLAGAAVFLASPASNYLNGFTIAVDGGWLGR